MLLFFASMISGQDAASCVVAQEFIYERAPFPSCHASTIAESKGHLVAAWFGGTREGVSDVGIWTSIREGTSWSKPVEVATGQGPDWKPLPCWNPVLFAPRSGPLLLFYKVGPYPANMWGMLMRSEDGGKTWSKPEHLPSGILGPIKNKPIELPSGTLICPSSDESHGWVAHMERTNDLGKTWTRSQSLNNPKEIGAIQPSILPMSSGHLVAIGRTQQHRIFSISSVDDGQTWGPMTLTQTPNPNSGIDAVALRDGRFLLVYNDTASGRSPLNLAVATEQDLNWTNVATLEDEKGAEFSYPAIIQTADGLVHITYTWKRAKIRHVVVDPAKIRLSSAN